MSRAGGNARGYVALCIGESEGVLAGDSAGEPKGDLQAKEVPESESPSLGAENDEWAEPTDKDERAVLPNGITVERSLERI